MKTSFYGGPIDGDVVDINKEFAFFEFDIGPYTILQVNTLQGSTPPRHSYKRKGDKMIYQGVKGCVTATLLGMNQA